MNATNQATGKDLQVSYILCNYNAEKLLRECISSIIAASANVSHEVIVVDDMSTDGSAEMVRKEFPGVKLIINKETLWYTGCCNEGLKAASGKYIYFLGTDTVISPGTVEKILEAFAAKKDAYGVTCRMYFPDGSFHQNASRDYTLGLSLLNFTFLGKVFPGLKKKLNDRYSYRDKAWDREQEIEMVGSCNLMVRKDVLDAAGGIDAGYKMYYSENALCRQITSGGGKIYYIPEGNVVHHLRGSVTKSGIEKIAKVYEQDTFAFLKDSYGFFVAGIIRTLIWFTNLLLTVQKGKRDTIFLRFLVKPE